LRAAQRRGVWPDRHEARKQTIIVRIEQEAFQSVGLDTSEHADRETINR